MNKVRILWALWVLISIGIIGVSSEASNLLIIPKYDKPPLIDGKVTVAEWNNAGLIDNLNLFSAKRLKVWGDDPRENHIYLCYDEKNLYIGFKLARFSSDYPETKNWGDDAIDILLDAYSPNDSKWRYFQLIVAKGKIIKETSWKPGWGPSESWAKNVQLTWNSENEQYYEGEMSIPIRDIYPAGVKTGDTWKFNLARTWSGDVIMHWSNNHITSSWSPQYLQNCDSTGLNRIKFGGESKITVSESKTSKPLTNLPLIKNWDCRYTLKARFLPTYNAIWVDKIFVREDEDLKKVKYITMSIRGDGGKKNLAKLYKQKSLENLHFELSDFPDGEYSFLVEWVGFNGETIHEENVLFKKDAKPPFQNTQIGLSKDILPPYLPLTVKEPNQVETICSKYRYNGMALLSKIETTQDEPTVGGKTEQILANDIKLFQTQNGKTTEIIPEAKLIIGSNQPHQVVLQGKGKSNAVVIEVINSVEYDGLNEIKMKILPLAKNVELDKLYLEIPLNEKQATLFHIIGDSNRIATAGELSGPEGVIWKSTELKNTEIKGNFKPMIWIGNEDRGLCWYADSDEGWSLDRTLPAQEIERRNNQIVLRINFINKKTVIQEERNIEFGIMATPSKPMPKDWKSWMIGSARKKTAEYKTWTFSPIYPNCRRFEMLLDYWPFRGSVFDRLPAPEDWSEVNSLADEIRKKVGGNIFLYACLNIEGGPIAKQYTGEWGWEGNGLVQEGSGAWVTKMYGEYEDNIDKYTGWGVRFYLNSIQNYRAWALDAYLKKIGNFAYYEDNEYLQCGYPEDPALNYYFRPASGLLSGYKSDNGEYQSRALISELRSFNERMATVYYENKMENLLAVHKSTMMQVPAFTFATFAIDGEQRFITDYKEDYIDKFPLSYVRAHIMGRQFGVVPIFLDEIKVDRDPENKIARSMYAVTLLHEIPVWPGDMAGYNMTIPELVWKLQNEFEFRGENIAFYPYWGQGESSVYQSDSQDIKVSLWKRPDRIMAVVTNLGEAKKAKIKLDVNRIWPKKDYRVIDWENKNILTTSSGEFELDLKRHDFRIIWIE